MMTIEEAAMAALGIFLQASPQRRLEALIWSQLPRITEWAKAERRALRGEREGALR